MSVEQEKPTPAIAAYMARIGAIQKNFRRWIVIDTHKTGAYYRELAVINLKPDGSVVCKEEQYAPTAEEAAAIAKEIAGSAAFPHSIEVEPRVFNSLKPQLGPQHYVFWNRSTGNIVMVQERCDFPDGKVYLPWSYWSDGHWRQMEPDGQLPFWKPPKPTGKRKIMVHEGAKTAAFVQALCEDPASTHPWAEDLRNYEHWGMIGGAKSPVRSNYAELHMANPDLVVYVCDNDNPGVQVPPVFSKNYRKAMRAVRFDNNFPESWDLADPMPEHMFSETGVWIGPSLKNYMSDATWATVPLPQDSPGRPTYKCNPEFAKDWFCTSSKLFVHRDNPHKILSEVEFNSDCRPFSDVKDTANYLEKCIESRVKDLAYVPGGPLLITTGSTSRLNTYVPSDIKPKAGDASPWEEFLAHLITTENDRHEVKKWIATLLARLEIRMKYALLMLSTEEGVGKGTLANEILRPLIGPHNVSDPDEAQICDSPFNSWMAHTRLAIVDEIYAGDTHRAANRLKSKISEPKVTINRKFMPEYTIDNYCHIIAFSNDEVAIKLSSKKDRRWLVPSVSEKKKPLSYWQKFRSWLKYEEGLNIILHWAHEFCENPDNVVKPGVEAPDTDRKLQQVESSFTNGQMYVLDLFHQIKQEFNGDPVIMFDSDLLKLLKVEVPDTRDSQHHIARVAKHVGYFVSKNRVLSPVTHVAGRIITNDEELLAVRAEDFKSKNITALNVQDLAQKWRKL